MKKFKDFNITPETKALRGDKIKLSRIFGKEIKVLDYKIEPSKQKENTECLTLQIEYQDEPRIVFTGSTVLIQMIKEVPADGFPFTTTITNNNEYYEFT